MDIQRLDKNIGLVYKEKKMQVVCNALSSVLVSYEQDSDERQVYAVPLKPKTSKK
jgi:hypothetical protein